MPADTDRGGVKLKNAGCIFLICLGCILLIIAVASFIFLKENL